jgi:dTDP-glucose 4,6-dehydratase
VLKHYTDVELRIPSIERAQQLLGYQPQVDLTDGLEGTIAWYRSLLAATEESERSESGAVE